MKKILLVLILSLLSHSSFSQTNWKLRNDKVYKNIRDVCSFLDAHITYDFNREEGLFNKCSKNVDCEDISSHLQKTKKSNLDDWQKLGCAVILYK